MGTFVGTHTERFTKTKEKKSNRTQWAELIEKVLQLI